MQTSDTDNSKFGDGSADDLPFRIPNSAFRIREDFREPRDWRRIWRDPPGFFLPNCPCCGSTPVQTYHVFGGLRAGTPSVRLSTNYEWTTGGWNTKAVLSAARDSMACSTPATSGPAYTYGGISGVSPFWLTQSDSYSPDSWNTNTAMPGPGRYRAAGVAIASLGYSWGGLDSTNTVLSQNDELTPGSPSTWTTKTAMPAARANGGATCIGTNGYFFCGDDSTPTQTRTNYEYDPGGDAWATKTQSPTPARNGMAVFTISGTAYVIDGGAVISRRNDSYVVDAWTTKSTPLGPDRQYCCGASIDALGVGWITGGLLQNGSTIATHDEYTPDTWTNRTNAPSSMQNGAASPA